MGRGENPVGEFVKRPPYYSPKDEKCEIKISCRCLSSHAQALPFNDKSRYKQFRCTSSKKIRCISEAE